MKTRVISALVGVAILLTILTTFHSVTFNIIALIVYGISLSEIHSTFKEKNSNLIYVVLLIIGSYFIMDPYIPRINPMILLCFFMTAYAFIMVFEFHKIDYKTFSASILFSFYVLIGYYSILNMKTNMPYEQFGWDSTFMFVVCCTISWGADIFAYFAGYFFGKHKLAPTLIPKKTKECAVGGVVGSVVLTWIFLVLYGLVKPFLEGTGVKTVFTARPFIFLAILALFGSFLSIFGDLFASAIKRQVGIKDYGKIMPGHGGILDRFDSVLLVSPLVSMVSVVVVSRGGIFNV